uniref:DUF2442 domain-containing protein n=1 Tax=Candidatus Kentrum sp. FM TaxID=2126340 RepID=A0A450TQT2_9GAMM|nr:MAG: Protein of unknown function (DUF2442) [Candidatus Kentron sp. FM]VFJ71382.1 MAG: Protein of unknown function (DUF2442) [Candidatus Kentron sp. FM]VFJ75409.1 MAG: Protein of unknown function (DUF2442) [Candidatus Kentron sp. FM]VFJ76149.1 MAG: Protein of unknown function (DUF2442) [Candidatus Kentron sp. FM]VFK19186.1 MAG: Protein of unknown function (DUF2442) [Candidatus Kentron sp. FM]
MNKYHRIADIRIKDGILSLIVDGVRIERNLKEISHSLEKSAEDKQNEFEVSPSGYGIHWPLIDEDLSIDGLLPKSCNQDEFM